MHKVTRFPVVFSVDLSPISVSLRCCLWRPSDSLRGLSEGVRRLSHIRGSPERDWYRRKTDAKHHCKGIV